MQSIDVLTTTVYPEMREHAEWLISKQDYAGDVRHLIASGPPVGGKQARRRLQAELLSKSNADLFMFADDDDYLPSWFISRCVERLESADLYGMIPDGIYFLRGRAYGEGTGRKTLFPTFTIYSRKVRVEVVQAFDSAYPTQATALILAAHRRPPVIQNLVIMRGLMDDTSLAITQKKNHMNRTTFPSDDPHLKKLEEWVGPEDIKVYRAFAEERGW